MEPGTEGLKDAGRAEGGWIIKGTAEASEILCLPPALWRAGINFKKLLLKLCGVFNKGLGAVTQGFSAEVLSLWR